MHKVTAFLIAFFLTLALCQLFLIKKDLNCIDNSVAKIDAVINKINNE